MWSGKESDLVERLRAQEQEEGNFQNLEETKENEKHELREVFIETMVINCNYPNTINAYHHVTSHVP